MLIGRTVLGEGGDINVGAKRRKCVCVCLCDIQEQLKIS